MKLLELDAGEGLGQYVGDHIVSRTMLNGDVTLGDSLTDEVKVNINMFHMSMGL